MSRGGAAPARPLVGWVFLARGFKEGITIRWQRGDREAHVLRGKHLGSWTMEGLLGKVPVSTDGWTDLAEVKFTAERWMQPK